jgi:phosphocarrier protein
MITRDIEVVNELGIHIRVAGKIAKTMKQFESSIIARTDGGDFDIKNVTGVIMTNAKKGETLAIEFDGADEQEAAEAVARLFADKFGEK